MSEQELPTIRKKRSASVIGQRALIVILVFLCLCFCAVYSTTVVTGCPVDDLYYRGYLQVKPVMPLPNDITMKWADGGQGTGGGWTGGLYTTTLSPEDVVDFYKHLGGSCEASANTVYKLGGFELNIHSRYWQCSVPAKPWSRGTVIVFPQAGYINALKAVYNNPPELLGGLTISETIVGYELSQFYGQPPFFDTDWPEGGAILEAWVDWCDPL